MSPACLTVNIRSATVILALRSAMSRFRATAYETLLLPEPWLAEVITSQDALLVAAQMQSPGALTANVPVPASLPNSALPGERS
jgi:hypothetical protein